MKSLKAKSTVFSVVLFGTLAVGVLFHPTEFAQSTEHQKFLEREHFYPAAFAHGRQDHAFDSVPAVAKLPRGKADVQAEPGSAFHSFHPAWSPDGRWIAFDAAADGDSEIFVVSVDGRTHRQLTYNSSHDGHPAWSPDGRQIAFESSRDGNNEIYTIYAAGWDPRRLTDHPASDVVALWSPDGSRIAFTSDRDGNREVYVVNADGSDLRRLTTNPGNDLATAWSPQGDRILMNSFRDGAQDAWVIAADGSHPVRLTTDAGSVFASWSPDGQRVAFLSRYEEVWDLGMSKPDGSDRGRVTRGLNGSGIPSWSPDGKRIAFFSLPHRHGHGEIYTIDADGGDLRRLTCGSEGRLLCVTGESRENENRATWSPDGTRVVFDSDGTGNHEVRVMNANGSSTKQISP